jgi:hypothetical protein
MAGPVTDSRTSLFYSLNRHVNWGFHLFAIFCQAADLAGPRVRPIITKAITKKPIAR